MQKTGIPLVCHCKFGWREDKEANGVSPPPAWKIALFGWEDSGTIKAPSHGQMLVTAIVFIMIDFPLWLFFRQRT